MSHIHNLVRKGHEFGQAEKVLAHFAARYEQTRPRERDTADAWISSKKKHPLPKNIAENDW